MSEQQDNLDRLDTESATGAGDTLVTIGTFPGPAEADLARAALDAAGIASFVQGENANSLLPVAFTARLQVRASDEAAARSVLEVPSDLVDVDVAEALTESRPL